MEGILNDLNDAQRRAVTHVEGPLLVLAGPGSGKTRVVTARIAHLIRSGIPAEQIVALSFTNKAADEMRRRLTAMIGPQPVVLGTFHRFAARLLRQHARLVGLTADYSILDPDDSALVLKRAARASGLSLTHTPLDRLGGVISRAKNDLLTPETFSPRWGRPAEETARRLWPVYQKLLLESDAVDFDDLLVHVATILTEHPELRRKLDARHRWILVDEYQDTNPVQYAIVRALSVDHPNLAVTGDPDQAIYGWRGASIRNILEFERDYPRAKVVPLEENYRSTANILATADRLIHHNTRRKPKRLVTTAAPGRPVRITIDDDGQAEADRIAGEIAQAVESGGRTPRDFVVLFRTSALSRTIEIALRRFRVPCKLVRGVEFFKRREIRDVMAWLRMVRNPRDEEAVLRALQAPPRGLGKTSIDRLQAWASERGTSLLDALREAGRSGLLSRRAATAADGFLSAYAAVAAPATSLHALMQRLLDRSGMRAWLEEDDESDEENRLANLEELVTAAGQFEADWRRSEEADDDPLSAFLDSTALVSDTDGWDSSGEHVSLMTFHAAKGLEFPVVYLVALEDGILPHERCIDDVERLEEERRLVFVGITRAKEELHASCTRVRDYRGSRRMAVPSMFLAEMDGSETLLEGAGRLGSPATCGADIDDFPQADDAGLPDVASTTTSHRRDDGLTFHADDAPVRRARPAPPPFPDDDAPPGARASPRSPVPAVNLGIGQFVRHATHGIGRVASISGIGPRAVATVVFDGQSSPRAFIIGHGSLVPCDGQPPEPRGTAGPP